MRPFVLLAGILLARPARAEELRPEVLQSLPRLAEGDILGLGAEASRARDALKGADHAGLERRTGGWALSSEGGATIPLSDRLGGALSAMNEYFGLPRASGSVAPLKPAFLSAEGVAAVRALFDQVLDRRIVLDGELLLPEIAGEATEQGKIVFHEMVDPAHALLPEVARRRDDAEGLRRLYRERARAMKWIDERGQLRQLLDSLPRWEARGTPPPEKRRQIQRQVAGDAIRASAERSLVDADAQLEALCSQRWSGRLLGPWHVHSPVWRADGWDAGPEPSDDDFAIAAQSQPRQNLTIVFHPDGFNVYDLSGGAPAPGAPRGGMIVYRDEGWRRHFQARHARIKPEL